MINNLSNTLIIGPGALGLGLGGLLSEQSTLYFLTRESSKEDSAPLKEYRYYFYDKQQKSLICGNKIERNFARSPQSEKIKLQTTWITTPAYSVGEAAQFIKTLHSDSALTSPDLILVCSNGLGVYEESVKTLGEDAPVCRALIEVGFRLESGDSDAPDGVRITGQPKIILAAPPILETKIKELAAKLSSKGWITDVSLSPLEAEWHKVIFNIFVNPTATILGCENGGILSRGLETALAAAAEAKKVANGYGINTAHLTDEALKEKIKFSANNICSTLAQIRSNKRTELDYITGAVMNAGARIGIETPTIKELHDKLTKMVELKII